MGPSVQRRQQLTILFPVQNHAVYRRIGLSPEGCSVRCILPPSRGDATAARKMPRKIMGNRLRVALVLTTGAGAFLAHGAMARAQPIVIPSFPSDAGPPPPPPAPAPAPDSVVAPPPATAEPPPPAAAVAPPSGEGGQMDLQSLLALFVTSASLQEEPIHETPGPVTVITDDMIRAIGSSTP